MEFAQEIISSQKSTVKPKKLTPPSIAKQQGIKNKDLVSKELSPALTQLQKSENFDEFEANMLFSNDKKVKEAFKKL